MTELKTLRQLADENGFPFEAYYGSAKLHVVGEGPNKNEFIAWWEANKYVVHLNGNANGKTWTLAKKQRTLVEYLYELDGSIVSGWYASEDDLKRFNVKILKVLRTEVIDD